MSIVINGSGTVSGLTEQASNVELTDNTKILVGTGDDLQIYHDGSHSYIDDTGTGDLIIRASDDVHIQKYTGETMINCNVDGSVDLYHNNLKRFETTATGATVIGDDSNAANFTVTSTAADDNIAPDLILYRNSASPADNDNLGGLEWQGNHSGGGINSYAQITCVAEDITDGTEDGALRFYTATGGSTSEKMRIDSGGRIGVGTASPSSYEDEASDLVIGNNGSSTGLTIASNNTTGNIYFSNGTSGNAKYRGTFSYSHANERMSIGTNVANRLSIDADGIKFGNDTAAANGLSDYEEGTWTPSITFSSSAPNVTYGNINAGHYTKIGNTVHFHMMLHVNAYNSGSGNLVIGGLPFAHTGTYTQRFITASLSADHLNWESDWVAVNLTNATGGTTGFTYTAQRDNAASEYIAQGNYPTGNTYHASTGHYYTDV